MKVHEILHPRKISEAVLKSWDISGSNDVSEMVDIIKRNYSQAIRAAKKGNIIYRGFKDGLPYAVNEIDFTYGSRSSRDSNNVYQLMMMASDGFKDYPSRSKSFICTTRKEYAMTYGGADNTFVILPHNNSQIAVLQYDQDIFGVDVDTHMFGILNILSVAEVVKDSITALGINFNFNQMADISSIDADLKKYGAVAFFLAFVRASRHYTETPLINLDAFTSDAVKSQYKAFIKPQDKLLVISAVENGEGLTDEGTQLLNYLNKNANRLFSAISSLLLTPRTMGTVLIDIGHELPQNNECWFAGKCIAVKLDILDEILNSEITFESVNAKLFDEGYEKTKLIIGDKYQLVAKAGYVKYGAKPSYRSDQFRIEAWTYKNNKRVSMIGWVNFENIDDNLQALDLSVNDKYRRQGIATEMYAFAKELGNTIAPSPKQTGMGKLFWNKDHS